MERSHLAGIAKEKVELTDGGGERAAGWGCGSMGVLTPLSDSSHAEKQGSEIPFPDPSFIPCKGALSK